MDKTCPNVHGVSPRSRSQCMHCKKNWQHSEECTCRMQNIAMRDYQESVTTGQTDARQSDPYVQAAR